MSEPARRCGACTYCCKVMGIAEIAKPAGSWCPHIKAGAGCGIYGAHPGECRAFACQWLIQTQLAPKYRPDRSKVVLTADGEAGRERLVANCDPATPLAWKREPIYGLLKQQATQTWGTAVTVVAKAGPRLWLITPDEDIDLGEADPRSTYDIDRSQPGKVRVTVRPPEP